MLTRCTWKEFRGTGLLWWINRTLHLFGWAIVVTLDEDSGEITDAYPARCKFRGFGHEAESEGFIQLSEYMAERGESLLREAKE